MNKKAMSAIVAMVLLVAFSITLGLLISSWSTGMVKKTIKRGEITVGSQIDCMNVKINLEDLGNEGVRIKNNGKEIIQGFVARIFTADSIEKEEMGDTIIQSFGVYDYFNGDLPTAVKLEIIPRISIGEEKLEIVDCVNKKSVVYLNV